MLGKKILGKGKHLEGDNSLEKKTLCRGGTLGIENLFKRDTLQGMLIMREEILWKG